MPIIFNEYMFGSWNCPTEKTAMHYAPLAKAAGSDYYVIDEVSGLAESASFNIDADSDIRRTCNISMTLFTKASPRPIPCVAWDVSP